MGAEHIDRRHARRIRPDPGRVRGSVHPDAHRCGPSGAILQGNRRTVARSRRTTYHRLDAAAVQRRPEHNRLARWSQRVRLQQRCGGGCSTSARS
jgi:hypothetical protein